MRDESLPTHDTADQGPLATRGRVIVLRPRGPFGKLLLAAVLVGAGIVLVTVGLALALTLVTAAAATGLGVIAYRTLGGSPRAPLERPLDPAKEIRPGGRAG